MWLRLGKIALPAACLGGLAWVLVRLEPDRILQAARSADPLLLVLSAVPLPIRFVIWSFKAGRIASRLGQVPPRTIPRLILAGALINLATPSMKLGGAVYRAAGMERSAGWDRSLAWGWTLADQVTNLLGGLLLFGVCGLASRFDPFQIPAGIAILVVGLFFLLRRLPWERMPASRARNLLGPLTGAGGSAVQLAGDIGLAAMSWFMLCIACVLAMAALGGGGTLMETAAVLAVGVTVGSLAGTGGLGVTELTLIGLFLQTGVDPAAAAAGTLLHRSMLYTVVVLWGGAALILGRRISSC